VTPVLSNQRAAGRARFESAFPVLCSGFLWADGCADSAYCEVSFYVYFVFLSTVPFCGFRFLCILVAIGCCRILDDGLALSFVLMSAIFIAYR